MIRVVAIASLVLVGLAGCGPTDEGPTGPTCKTGEVVCGAACCNGDQVCNTATATCEAKCVPSCRNRECGSDGCGGVCGTCQSGFNCQPETGLCYACKPSCDGKACGSDGCGGSCGNCPTGTTCRSGACGACEPQCSGKQCGSDGCGGQCGTCPGGACDPSGKCVECMGDGDCASSANGKKCSPDRRCVACLTNNDCKSDGSIVCDTSTNRCQVGCTNDGDCSGTPGAPRCDTQQSKCVACLGSGDCSGLTPSCDPGTRTCVACASDSECISRGAGNRCLDKQQCVECLSNGDCGGGTCNLTIHKCGECTIDADCSGNPTKKLCDTASRTCVACRTDGNCGGATPACHSTSRTCVECTSDANCSGKPGRTRCQTSSSTCVQCLSSADCGGASCQSGQCVGSTAGGDTCSAPGVINLSSGTATISGDLSTANHDLSALCGGSGRDVVYSFTLASPKDVTVSVSAVTSGMRPIVYLATSCTVGPSEIACANTGTATSSFSREGLAAGTYFLWVDSTAGFAQGQFTLTVTAAEPPPPVAGDLCGNAIPITFNAQGNATVTGTLNGAKGDYTSPNCGNSAGPEVVYRFTTQYAGQFSATVISHASSFRPTLSLWSSCPASSVNDEPRCQTATTSATSASLTHSTMPAGVWYLAVDSVTAATGAFDLQVTIPTTAPPVGGERCSEATPISISGNAGTASGTTVGRAHDASATTCSELSSPDAVYTFNNPAQQNVLVRLKNKSSTYAPAIYLQGPTCGGSNLTCRYTSTAGGNLIHLAENVPAGPVYLWVDSYTGTSSSPVALTSGAFDLKVNLGIPIAGTGADSCSSLATSLTMVDGFAIARGAFSTSLADNRAGGCAAGSARDVVHRFTLPSGYSKLNVYVQFDDAFSISTPAVHLLRGSNCATAVELGCGAGLPLAQNWAEYSLTSPPADTYYVWIDWMDDIGFGFAPTYSLEVLAE